MKEMHLMPAYNCDPQLRKLVGYVLCLPMLPRHLVASAFLAIKSHAMVSHRSLKRYFKYVDDNWITSVRNFDIADWNCHRKV